FGVSCIGSRGITGQLPEAWLSRVSDGRDLAEGIAEDADLLGKKIEDFEIVIELDILVNKRARHLQRRDDPGNAVKAAAIRHRVGMRAD
ncbi:hypothetical protein ACC754_39605, partial [Rhizobium johnstonii]